MRIHYHTTTSIWLHFEDYYNQGITSKEAENVLRNICDPFGNNYLYPESSGFNGNWIVQTRAKHPSDVSYVVMVIESEMNFLLAKKRGEAVMV